MRHVVASSVGLRLLARGLRSSPLAASLALLCAAPGCITDDVATTDAQSSSSGSSSTGQATTQTPTTDPTTTTLPTTGEASSSSSSTSGTSTSGTDTSTSTGTSTDTGSTTGTIGETSGTSTSTGGDTDTGDTDTGGLGQCCSPQNGPSCGDPAIEACVCALDEFCCVDHWDEFCAAEVEEFGCGQCGAVENVCCEAGVGPGCVDDAVEACVCAQLPECCSDAWSLDCAIAVEALACGVCEGGDCCAEQAAPGCGDPGVAACVCAADPFCCEGQWDSLCVQEVDLLGCAVCPVPPGPCCEAGAGASCETPEIAACVCAVDPSCCSDVWTAECAAMVETLACGTCTNCCAVQEAASCDDPDIAACVCAFDDFCCTDTWDDVCVSEVEDLGCAVCI